jgi:uncharacterized protein YukE
MDALGDPAAMRQQATFVRTAAESVAAMVDRLDRQIDDMVFEGAAAARVRANAAERHARARRTIADLLDVADRMLLEAHLAEQRSTGGPGR